MGFVQRRNAWLGLMLLLVVLFAPSLRSHDPWNPDEPRYAAVAREMAHAGDFVLPRLEGRIYAEKPPLFFALSALLSQALGTDTVLAGRLVALAGTLVALLATVGLARRVERAGRTPQASGSPPGAPPAPGAATPPGATARADVTDGWGGASGASAAAMLITTHVVLYHAQQGLLDPVLLGCATLATLALLRAGDAADGPSRIRFLLWTGIAALACVAGALVKGPAILLSSGAAALVWRAAERRRLRAAPWVPVLVALALTAAALLAWLSLAARRAGPEGDLFWQRMSWDQTAGRMVDSWSHKRPPWFYLQHLGWMAFPWALLLPGALIALFARGRSAPLSSAAGAAPGDSGEGAPTEPASLAAVAPASPALWAFLASLLAWSLVSGKRPGYLLPAFPLLAIVIAAHLRALAQGDAAPHRADRIGVQALILATLLAGIFAALAPGVAPPMGPWIAARLSPDAAAALTLALGAVPRFAVPLGIALGAGLAVTAWALRRSLAAARWDRVPLLGAAAVALAYAAFHLVGAPAIDPVKSFRAFGEAVARTVPADARVILYPNEWDGQVGWYRGVPRQEVIDPSPEPPGRLSKELHGRLALRVLEAMAQRREGPSVVPTYIVAAEGAYDVPPGVRAQCRLLLRIRAGSKIMLLYEAR